jgi:hypothetical protein
MDERFSAMQLTIQMATDQTFVTGIDQPVQNREGIAAAG